MRSAASAAFGRSAGLWVAGLLALFLNGCMMWMHGGMHGSVLEDPAKAGTVLVKEVQRGDILLSAELPPLRAGREATLVLMVENGARGVPVAGAEVEVSIRRRESGGVGGAVEAVEGRAREGAAAGAYEFRYTFPERGWYEITFTVQSVAGAGEGPVALVVQGEVARASSSVGNAHHGGNSRTAAVLIGAVMAAMMLFML